MILDIAQPHILNKNQYVDDIPTFSQNQIVLHHTAGGTAKSTIDWWKSNSERVATHFVIDRDGTIYQCVPLNRWAFHIYIGSKGNRIDKAYKSKGNYYDQISIGIEICSWGQLTARNGSFFNYMNRKVPAENVAKINPAFRGFYYYEKYTDAQIESVKSLILKLSTVYPGIPLKYNDLIHVSKSALNGEAGIFSHGNYRTDKNDCYPYPGLITMLKSLSNGV